MTRLSEIQARAEAAQDGPWKLVTGISGVDVSSGKYRVCVLPITTATERDAAFIAHAREDVPWLLSEVARLLEALEMCAHSANANAVAARAIRGDEP